MLSEEEYDFLKHLDETQEYKFINGIPVENPKLEQNSQLIYDGNFKVALGVLMKYTGSEEEVTIPEEVTSIDEFAFDEDTASVRKVFIPDTVKEISRCAFEGCPNLEEVHLPGGLEILETCVFSDCGNLKTIEIPDTVKTIGECAFYNCTSLSEVTVPDSVQKIDNCAFFGCHALEHLVLPDALTDIGQYAFKECDHLAGDDQYVTVKNVLYDYFGTETRISIPEQITRAEDDLYEDIEDDLTYLYCEYRQIPGFPDHLKHLAARTFLTNKENYSAAAAKEWEQYIAGEKLEFLREFIQNDDAAAMKGLMEFAEYSEDELDRAIDGISKKSQTAIMAILLEYRNRHFRSRDHGLGHLDAFKL